MSAMARARFGEGDNRHAGRYRRATVRTWLAARASYRRILHVGHRGLSIRVRVKHARGCYSPDAVKPVPCAVVTEAPEGSQGCRHKIG
jgi:hypothetical protein